MTTDLAENPVITETPSELPETPSEPVEFVPSEETQDEQPTEVTGETTPEVSDDVEEEPESEPAPTVETALDKRRAIEKGEANVSLSAEEYRLLREHDRAEENRRRDYERTEAERKQQVEALQTEYANATKATTEEVFKLADWLSRFGQADDPVTRENVATRIENLMNGLQGKSNDIIMQPHLERQREMIRAAYGENPTTETLRSISNLKSQEQILSFTYEMGRAQGQGEGAPDGMVLVAKKDHERWTKADKVAAKASSGGESVPPSGRSTRVDTRSDNEILMDPTTPVEKLIEIRNRQNGIG